MSVEKLLGLNPAKVARDALEADRERKRLASRRVQLYTDDSQALIEEEIGHLFKDATVKARLRPFAKLAKSQALFKRVVDEAARPCYAVSPVRRVTSDVKTDQELFAQIASECRLNEKMDLSCRLVNACNHVFTYTSFVKSRGIVVSVITPDMMTVIPHPDDPTEALAYIYDRPRIVDGKRVVWRVYWDSEICFQLNDRYELVSFAKGEDPYRRHGMKRMPFVAIHRRERWGDYWDTTSGSDLESAQLSCSILTLLSMRLLKAQGFNQVVISGDVHNFPKGQLLDEESALQAPADSQVTVLNNKTDAAHYLALLDSIKVDAAANRGVSRARLNQTGADASDDLGLMEERAEIVKVMRKAELDQFEVLKAVSVEAGTPLDPDAKVSVDFGEVQHRVDRKTQLEIRETERRMGLRTVLDDIREDNPEIVTDKEAEKELAENVEINAKWVEKMRALNMSKLPQADEAGQDAETNGAMGPAVRDGDLSKDQAAERAKGRPDVRALAKRALARG